MSNFMLLFRGTKIDMSPAEFAEHMKKWGAWMESLGKSGNFKSGEPLTKMGRVVSGKKKAVTDGPYSETKDLVGGYIMISAKDLNHATELAMGCPIYDEGGSVEIREVRKTNLE